TNPQIMGWIMDTYSMNMGYSVPGVVTGKPIEIGGSQGRNEATARGCVFTILEACKHYSIDSKGATVAIQGYGNAGLIAHRLIEREGYKVIAVSDSKGGIINEKGLSSAAVAEHKNKNGTVLDFPGAKNITNAELLELKVDVLIPAALENQITAENAPRIKAKIVAEAANGPTTPEADDILHKNGVFVIPDILCNAGGVTVSYFEWVQNLQAHFWEENEINQKLRQIMVRAFNEVVAIREKEKVDTRMSAYILAVDRVARTIKIRGIFP
ncbi:MAG: Glu/Leu/Phe/Val dehydrogenase, partial [Elusimicrobiota bacterium]